MINTNDDNYFSSILCFQRPLRPIGYVILNPHGRCHATSVLCDCLNVFTDVGISEEQRGAAEVSGSHSTARWGGWKVKLHHELQKAGGWKEEK